MRAAREFLLWWVVLSLLWLELVSSSSIAEIATGIGCGAVGAGAAMLGRTEQRRGYRLRPGWLRWFLLAVPGTVSGSFRLARLLARPRADREAGALRLVRLPQEREDLRAGRRALAVVVLGLSPSSYVVNTEGDELLVHELGRSSGSRERGADPLLTAVTRS